jgi:hypothetical protein
VISNREEYHETSSIRHSYEQTEADAAGRMLEVGVTPLSTLNFECEYVDGKKVSLLSLRYGRQSNKSHRFSSLASSIQPHHTSEVPGLSNDR